MSHRGDKRIVVWNLYKDSMAYIKRVRIRQSSASSSCRPFAPFLLPRSKTRLCRLGHKVLLNIGKVLDGVLCLQSLI